MLIEKKEIVMFRKEYKDIPFNTKISSYSDCQLITMCNGETRRINKIEDNILNPSKRSLFSKNKIDQNCYSVFQVKSIYFDGTWGGNVQYLDTRLNNIQEKVFIRALYSYQIYSPEKAVLLISEYFDKYESKYFNIKINKKIDNVLKKYILNCLNKYGFIKTQSETIEIAKEAEQIINESILSTFGIMITNLNFMLEESNDHYQMRKEIEWNKGKEV